MIATVTNLYDYPIVIANTENMPRDIWLKERMGGIGASDAAAVMGFSRYSSPVVVYFDKTEELPAREFSERSEKKMAAGNRMENVIAEWFAEETGKKVVRQPYLFAHPTHTFMRGNIDFGIEDEDAGLECKNTDNPKDWQNNAIPDEYWVQCQQYMAITGKSRWYLAFCLSGWDFDYRIVERSDHFIEQLISTQAHFWNEHVLKRIPPAFDGSEAASELIGRLYPEEQLGEVVELEPEIDELIATQEELRKEAKELENEITRITNVIKDRIGDNEIGLTPTRRIKFTTVNVKEKVVAAYSFRRLWLSKRA